MRRATERNLVSKVAGLPDYLSAGSAQGTKISKRNGLRGITIPVHPAVTEYLGAPAAEPSAPGAQPKAGAKP